MYYIKIAITGFKCPVSGVQTRRGEVYIEDEAGKKLHLNQLPKRRLVPLKEYQNANKARK